jgi:hypothetical protein
MIYYYKSGFPFRNLFAKWGLIKDITYDYRIQEGL